MVEEKNESNEEFFNTIDLFNECGLDKKKTLISQKSEPKEAINFDQNEFISNSNKETKYQPCDSWMDFVYSYKILSSQQKKGMDEFFSLDSSLWTKKNLRDLSHTLKIPYRTIIETASKKLVNKKDLIVDYVTLYKEELSELDICISRSWNSYVRMARHFYDQIKHYKSKNKEDEN
ncbi:hypothetical protein CWI36_0278p0020 [Hamiltosporidium magnivora]|uniref:Uncharacterized protein n=1 Tax=Hamiltosporidium magnivora TaxID=148818 RepID=A0A4Q9LH25_9MICR|nr:hypothetical protein CWI36_0278p0020 [Hamiltosporidium magnivora]